MGWPAKKAGAGVLQNFRGKRSLDHRSNVCKFPRRPAAGWLRRCRCGSVFRLPYHAATIRDGRQSICVPCFVEEVRNGR